MLYNAASAAQHVKSCFILLCPLQFKEYLQRAEDIKALLNGQQPVTATPANGAQKARGPGGGAPPGGNGGGGGGGGDVSYFCVCFVYVAILHEASVHFLDETTTLVVESSLPEAWHMNSLRSQVHVPTLSTLRMLY